MKTLSTKMQAYEYRTGLPYNHILSLTDGTNTYYFSTHQTTITDGDVYPILEQSFSITEGFDIFSRKWVSPSVRVSLSNSRIQRTDDPDWVFPGDLFGGIVYRTAKMYLQVGADMNALSDMLVIFSGVVADTPEIESDRITINLRSPDRAWNIKLPNTIVGDVYAGAPAETINVKIPLVYGEFTASGSLTALMDYSGTGLAAGVQSGLTDNVLPEWVFADHVIEDFDSLWAVHPTVDLAHPGLAYDPIFTENDSGYATATVDTDLELAPYYLARAFSFFVEFQGADATGYDIAADSTITNPEYAFDGNEGTIAIAEGTATSTPYSFFYLNPAISRSSLVEIGGVGWFDGKYQDGADAAGVTSRFGAIYVDNVSGNDCRVSGSGTWSDTAAWQTVDCGVIPGVAPSGLGDYGNWISPAVDGIPLCVTLVHNDGGSAGQEMIEVLEARFRITTTLSGLITGWAALTGKCFEDSWIDSRSSNYSNGDMIEDGVQIVQDLLRERLSLSDTEIDHASFSAAENTGHAMRINLHDDNQMYLYDVIRQLSEQGYFGIYQSADGQWRAVDLDNKTPTADRTIYWGEIKPSSFSLSTTSNVINQLVYKTRFLQEYDDYYQSDTVDDATSQTDYDGTYRYEANWPNIAGTDASTLAAWMVNTTDGIWSKDHAKIRFVLRTFAHIALQVGDYISLDNASFVGHHKLFGDAWTDRVFLITERTPRPDGTEIVAVELYE